MKSKIIPLAVLLLTSFTIRASQLHVAINGNDANPGTGQSLNAAGQSLRAPFEGAIELRQAQVLGGGQPDPLQPALVAGELGARPGKALRGHRQQGGLMRCVPLLGREPVGEGGDRG